MKYSMLTSISKALSLALIICSLANGMHRKLIVLGLVERAEEALLNEYSIAFGADCTYQGIPGNMGVMKTIIDNKPVIFYGEFVSGTQENPTITKLFDLVAGTSFDILSGAYINQNSPKKE